MRKTSIILGVCSLAMLTACKKDLRQSETGVEEFASASRSDNPIAQAASDPYVSNEILVKFAKGSSETARANALARIGGNVKERIATRFMERLGEEGFYVVHTPLGVLEAVQKAKGSEVEWAEPNYIYTYGATSNDTYFTNGSLWGMYGSSTSPANQYGSNAAAAWVNNTGSASVLVGVIDEGIQFNHPDLDGQVWTNPYDGPDGRDNDGNGYVDDIHGWDFDGNDNTIYDGGSRGNLDKHGTHVSGTIGGKGGNGAGVAGVNWKVTIISCKFLGRRGGTTANAVKAVDYLNDLKSRHNLNIVASNNSWGGGGYSQALQDAINRAAKADILFIAAAGNGGSDGSGDNNDATANYPSNYVGNDGSGFDNVIAVAAITSSGAKASYSNYGATTVDLGAPGSGIYSTLPPNTYGSYSGTSMATPHVTGAAALYKASHSSASGAAIKNAILSAVVPTSSLNGKTLTGGRLNVGGF